MNAIARSTVPTLPWILLTVACSGSSSPGTGERGSPKEDTRVVLGVEKLETGVDLSHLKTAPTAGAATFPEIGNVAPVRPSPIEPTAPAAVDPGPPGKIETISGEHDFGDLLEGETASYVFRVRAGGENPLVIHRIKPSCGCTAAEVRIVGEGGETTGYQLGEEIPVGTELEIPTELKTANRRGAMQTNVAIYSNDPASPVRLKLSAEVQPVLSLEPRLLDFQRITSAEVKEGSFQVSTTVLDPFMLTLDETQIVEPLSVELSAVDPDAEGKSREWDVRVALGPNIPEGIRRYPIRLITDLPAAPGATGHGHENEEDAGSVQRFREITANVQAQVSGLVIATPNFVSMGLVRPGQVIERTVRISTLDQDFQLPSEPESRVLDLRGEPLEWADAFSVAVEPLEGGRALDVKITLEGLPEDMNGSFGGMVQLDVGHPTKETLNVRFSGVCRPGETAAAGPTKQPGG